MNVFTGKYDSSSGYDVEVLNREELTEFFKELLTKWKESD